MSTVVALLCYRNPERILSSIVLLLLPNFSLPTSSLPFPVSIDYYSTPFFYEINFLAFRSEWEYVVFAFVCLGHFTEQKTSSSMHTVANEGIPPLFIVKKHSIVYAHQLSVDGHCGWC